VAASAACTQKLVQVIARHGPPLGLQGVLDLIERCRGREVDPTLPQCADSPPRPCLPLPLPLQAVLDLIQRCMEVDHTRRPTAEEALHQLRADAAADSGSGY